MEHLEIRIDRHVFRLKDPKVDRLRTAKLSVEAFALLIAPGDPYVMIDNTIYALTEAEYYAMRAVKPMQTLSDAAFRRIMDDGASVASMSEPDRRTMERIAKDLPHCPACRYRRHKDTVWKLAKKYGLHVARPDEADEKAAGEYPETLGPIPPLVSGMLDRPYAAPPMDRVPCIDCVEKHLAQAAVLSDECRNGYPEYLSLVIGHLAESLDELPKEFHVLGRTIEFCLARTQCFRRPFVPLAAIAAQIDAARSQLGQPHDDRPDDGGPDMALDLTDAARSELSALDAGTSAEAVRLCRKIEDFIPGYKDEARVRRLGWEGSMASLGDLLSVVAPSAAAVVRNRRLMFVACPQLAAESGYSMEDFLELLDREAAGDDVGSGLQAVQGVD